MNQYILGELKPYRRRLPHKVLWLVVSQEGVWVIVCALSCILVMRGYRQMWRGFISSINHKLNVL